MPSRSATSLRSYSAVTLGPTAPYSSRLSDAFGPTCTLTWLNSVGGVKLLVCELIGMAVTAPSRLVRFTP